MADYNSSLPVRTETDGDVVNKIVGLTSGNVAEVTPNNELLVHDIEVLGELVAVNAELVSISGDLLDINNELDLISAEQIVQTTALGNIYSALGDVNTELDTQTTALGDINTTQTDGTQKTKITDGTDDLEVNPDGSINVVITEGGLSATEKHVYASGVAGVPNTPNTTIDYTVTATKTFTLKKVQATGSGKIKVEVKAGTPASETTRAVAFNSTATPNVEITFPSAIEVVAGDKILVIITNLDKANQDLYAFINGNEV